MLDGESRTAGRTYTQIPRANSGAALASRTICRARSAEPAVARITSKKPTEIEANDEMNRPETLHLRVAAASWSTPPVFSNSLLVRLLLVTFRVTGDLVGGDTVC